MAVIVRHVHSSHARPKVAFLVFDSYGHGILPSITVVPVSSGNERQVDRVGASRSHGDVPAGLYLVVLVMDTILGCTEIQAQTVVGHSARDIHRYRLAVRRPKDTWIGIAADCWG